jgi:hypothetical protein
MVGESSVRDRRRSRRNLLLLQRAALVVLMLGAAFLSIASSKRTYCVRRAAVVPLPAPSMRPAKQASGYVEAGLASDTAIWAKPPKRLAGRNVGLYVPREQLGGFLAFSPHPIVSVGTSFEYGLGAGAVPISKGLIPPPKRGVGGGGLHFSLHFKLSPMVTLDWTSDVWGYEIPSRVAYTEKPSGGDCPDYDSSWSDKIISTRLAIARTQLAVGLDFGRSHLTLGMGLRNHPYNDDATEEAHWDDDDIGPRLEHAAYPYIHAGWEIHITEWAHATVGIYQPLNFDPVIYAPIIGVSFRITQVVRKFVGGEPEPSPEPAPPAEPSGPFPGAEPGGPPPEGPPPEGPPNGLPPGVEPPGGGEGEPAPAPDTPGEPPPPPPGAVRRLPVLAGR